MADTSGRDSVINQFQTLGWSREQSIGLAANFAQESNFNPSAVGDGGKAYGIGQWHPDRQAEFRTFAGKDIQASTLQEQVAFADYELRKGREQAAGNRLKLATTPHDAAATVSQFYERPRDVQGERVRRAGIARQFAGLPANDDIGVVAPPNGSVPDAGNSADWPRLPTLAKAPTEVVGGQKDIALGVGLANSQRIAGEATGTPQDTLKVTDAMYQAQAAEQAKRDATGIATVFQTARQDPRDQAMFTVLDHLSGNAVSQRTEPAGTAPNWYEANRNDIERGLTSDEEIGYMRENVKGPNSLLAARAQLQVRRDADETYGHAGGWANFLGRMGGGLMDPVGFAAGMGAGKALELVGLGSRAAIAAGKGGKAALALGAEGALGNVAVEGIQDSMGEVKTSSDYAMAAAMGVLFTAPFMRGAHAQASQVAAEGMAKELHAKAVREQVDKVLTYRRRTGEGDPSKVADAVATGEARDIDTALTQVTNPTKTRDQVVPEEVQIANRAEHEQGFQKPEPPPPPPPEVKPLVPEVKPEPRPVDVPTRDDSKPGEVTALDPNTEPKLPSHLEKATPTYAVGKNKVTLAFESAFDKALYIVSGKGKSKAHEEYLDYLRQAGVTDPEIDQLGKVMREWIKKQAKTAREDGTGSNVTVPASGHWKTTTQRLIDARERAKLDTREVTDPSLRQDPIPHDPPTAEVQGKDELAFPSIDAEMITPVERQIPAADRGAPLTLGWFLNRNHDPAKFPTHTVREVLEALTNKARDLPGETRAVAQWLKGILGDSLKDVHIEISDRARGKFDPNSGRIETPGIGGRGLEHMSLNEKLDLFNPWHFETVVHEIIHAATHAKIEAIRSAKRKLTPELYNAGKDYEAAFEAFRASILARYPELKGHIGKEPESAYWRGTAEAPHSGQPEGSMKYALLYAAQDMHEFATMTMTDPAVRTWMKRQPGTPVAGQPSSLWKTLIGAWAKLIGNFKADGNMLHTTSAILDRMISADGSNIRYMSGESALMGPTAPTLSGPAASSGIADRKAAVAIFKNAKDWLLRNPIDVKRLAVITAKLPGGLSDGLVLARSRNPVLQMIAGLVTETTTGAAGRNATVAVAQNMLHRKFIGDAMLRYDEAFASWGDRNGATVWDKLVQGDKKREFGNAVYKEILDRKSSNYKPQVDKAIIDAADHLEGALERARKAQVDAGTLGSGALPGNSRGYIPQALDGAKLQTLTTAELDSFHAEISSQFQANLGWDKKFADTFAPYYTDRVRKRAQGAKEIDGLAAGGDSMTIVRDTLDEMGFDPSTRDRMTAGQRTGSGHTKARLDLDLQKEFVPGKRLMDVYHTDPLNLTRQYVRRNAGHVALAEQGILGIKGVRQLRNAAEQMVETGTQATREELDAFDRVMAEILGTPVAGQVTSAGATNLALIVNLQRLGGLAFTQAAEMFNMIHHLGMASLFRGVAALPRMLGEVGRLNKGQASGNHILSHIEAYGGEIGTDHWKMVAPLDPPDARIEDYMKQAGLLGRLLRGGGHLQTKVSFFRGLMAAQHRAVAEQIVMKAARFINEAQVSAGGITHTGGNVAALHDMGFTDDMIRSLKNDLPNVAQWDASGKLISFDLTRVSDPRTAEAFVQAVHRGTSQIIQGTFIGERSKWAHNDYMKLLLQLRTFGLTSSEKQLQRTAMIHGSGLAGYSYAAGIMLGQMALALPIHMARVQVASAGRSDRDQFVKDNLNPAALVRATMNYSSISGSTGDVMELLTSVAGGWGNDGVKETLGVAGRQQAQSVGRLIPAAGTIDTAFKVLSGKSDIHTFVKQLPFSNLPYLIPAINLTKD